MHLCCTLRIHVRHADLDRIRTASQVETRTYFRLRFTFKVHIHDLLTLLFTHLPPNPLQLHLCNYRDLRIELLKIRYQEQSFDNG